MASYLPKGTKLPKKPAGAKGVNLPPRSLKEAKTRVRGGQAGYAPKGTKPKTTVKTDTKAVTDPKRPRRSAPKPEVNPGTRPKRPVGRKPSKRPTPSRPTRGPIKPMPTPRPGSGPKPKPKTPRGGLPVRPTRSTTARPSRRGVMAGMRRRLRGMRGRR